MTPRPAPTPIRESRTYRCDRCGLLVSWAAAADDPPPVCGVAGCKGTGVPVPMGDLR